MLRPMLDIHILPHSSISFIFFKLAFDYKFSWNFELLFLIVSESAISSKNWSRRVIGTWRDQQWSNIIANNFWKSTIKRELIFCIEVVWDFIFFGMCRFFVYANVIGCAFSFFSLFLASIFGCTNLHKHKYFYLFIHDMVRPTF